MSLAKSMLKWILLIILTFQASNSQSVVKWEIEIYLLTSLEAETGKDDTVRSSSTALLSLPFIADGEILGYKIGQDYQGQKPSYSIVLNNVARAKLNKLNIPVCCGRHFVITVNKRPIFDGYFWCTYSSYSCGFLTVETPSSNDLKIQNGYPKEHSFGEHPDPRGDVVLLQAFRESERLYIIR